MLKRQLMSKPFGSWVVVWFRFEKLDHDRLLVGIGRQNGRRVSDGLR
jgi:hypothetical protein